MYIDDFSRVMETIKKLEDDYPDWPEIREKVYMLAKRYPDVFVEIFGDAIKTKEEKIDDFIKKLSKTYSKIGCIRAVRNLTGLGIKESKFKVEDLVPSGEFGYKSDFICPKELIKELEKNL